MKTLSVFLLFCFFCAPLSAAELRSDFVFATTIDFLDYVFYDKTGPTQYYDAKIYEQSLKKLADAGIKKLYLRVNVRGLSFYPSKVTSQYGENNAFHWQTPVEAKRLIETLKRYDLCTETIRIGHKYGMEVWAWESLYEDGGLNSFKPSDMKYLEVAKKLRFDAMNNPRLYKHPEYFWMYDPKMKRETEPDKYFDGVAELTVPAVMKHKLERFAELTKYPFDGFIFNLRNHPRVKDPENYGFNPEVRKKFLARYGKDIWKDKINLADLHALRAEAVADFFKGCKALTGGRPLYMSGLPPADWKAPLGTTPISIGMYASLMPMPCLYKRYFQDGSIDGVIMVGYDFSDYFTPKVTGRKSIKLGIFREAAHLRFTPPKGYNFAQDMKIIYDNKRLNEVELYETLTLTHQIPKWLNVVRELTGHANQSEDNVQLKHRTQ